MPYERIKALIEYLENGGISIRLSDGRVWAFNREWTHWDDTRGYSYAFRVVFNYVDWEPDIPNHNG